MSYHNRIMNIPARIPGYPLVIPNLDYREGHRDARHAAAEMAIQADETIRCMTETLDKIGAMLGVEPGDVDGLAGAIDGLSTRISKLESVLFCIRTNAAGIQVRPVTDVTALILADGIIEMADKALAAGEAE